MNRKFFIYGGVALVAAFLVFIVIRAINRPEEKIDPGFSEYITAFTSGIISSQSGIEIVLAKEMDAVEINSEVDEDLFDFDPGIDGKAYWVNNQTIEFRPEKPLKSGKKFFAKFYLNKLYKNIPKKFKVFEFSFQIISQAVAVELEGYQPYSLTSLTWNNVTGVVRTADFADDALVEKMFTAKQKNNKLKISWIHNSGEKIHQFTVDSVEREVEPGEVELAYDGSALDCKNSGREIVKIPSINDFSVIKAEVVHEPKQYVEIRFSDPLDPNQDLNGLINFDNGSTLTFEIDKMVIKAYPSAQQSGSVIVKVEPGIRSVAGAGLKDQQEFELSFQSIKPGIKLIGKGVILPGGDKGMNFPFQAVNIRAVDVKIIKIFENNITQFLQVNNLDGANELKRAGRLIKKKTIRLDAEKPLNFSKWNNFSIDLSELIKQEPGALYRVQLSFKKDYSTYPCAEGADDKLQSNLSSISGEDEISENEIAFWDSPSYYYEGGYYDDEYDWEQREDPCTPSYYYGSQVTVARNVFASDLGIIVKGTSDNSLFVSVADLLTTQPKGGVELEVYSYQRQLMATGKTDAEGFCNISLNGKPFLVVAKDGNQRGYLRVDDGTALSLSNFDVSGVTLQKGLKGFMYGERGVWRPGDTVYLTFVLEDEFKKLPANHPVSFEVFNPQGKMHKRIIKTNGVNGFYQFNFATEDADPTGNWEAVVKIGGTTFSKQLKIETVKPNRLKILFDFPDEIIKGSVSAELNAKWLHGAPAKSMKAKVTATLSATTTSFKGYEGFVFDDPVRKFETEEQTIFDGTLNESGNATVSTDVKPSNSTPGMVRANFVTRVFESGGDFSIDRFSKIVSPYTSYVGVKPPKDEYGYLYTDTTQFFEVVTLTPEGKPINKNNLEFKIYKLEWRWWWDAEDGSDLANFSNNTYSRSVFSTDVNTVNGKARVKYRLSYPDWGRFLVRVTDPLSGHTTGKIVYFDWPGWRGRGDRGDAKGATMLLFNSDKKAYKVGEKATIIVPSSEGGRMLVSLETGSQVLKKWWVETKKKETKTTFEITGPMAPNVYAHVTMLQPHGQVMNDLPMRLYGVIPILVEDPATKLTPVISMPEVMEPEKPVTVKVSEKNNQKMTYTLAIVDEGLLDLTRFKTPDPWSTFYAREALGVKTWDLYDMVVGAFGGKIESLFAIGGDDEMRGKSGQKANRFKPVVKVLGPFTLNSGTDKHTITLPQYVGSVRVMVVAGNNGAYGKEEKTVPVRMPLMVLATMPRVVGPGEEVALPVSVFAMEKRIKNFTVEVIPNEYFQVLDSRSKNQDVKEPGEFDLAFRLKVISKEGIGRVKVIVRSGKEKAEYDVEINVRNPNSRLVRYSDTMVEAGKAAEIPYELIGMTGTNKATLEVSSIPPIDLSRRLGYLLAYPYGCIEQTTSGAFPQLFLEQFIELDKEAKKIREANINTAIQRLNSMMLGDGGFSYWPGMLYADDWGSSYAGHFMLEAEKKGFSLPSGFKRNWLNYQKRAARNWASNRIKGYFYHDELSQAYRLYTLALAKEQDLGAMNRLKELPGLSQAAAWRLAAAYALIGQVEVAKQIIARSNKEITSYDPFNLTYGSIERDWAMMLETLSLVENKTEAFTYLKKVSNALSSDRWMSTQSTAYGLLAVSKFLENEKTSRDIQCIFSGGGKSGIRISTLSPLAQVKLDAYPAGAGKINISNTGKGIIFARVVTEGIPETGPDKPFENNLKLDVVFKDKDGRSIDISRLEQGTDFVAEVTIRNIYSSHVTNLALNQVFPSGWEIGNDRMDNVGAEEANNFTYQDIRDDRVYTFFDLSVGYSKKFRVRLTAAYAGRFYFPGVLCEAMYEPGVNAFVPGQWVEVVK